VSTKFLLLSLKSFGYAKVIQKKERKKRREFKKMDKCPRYLKQWLLTCPPEKKKG
jgi:hypothetical protein